MMLSEILLNKTTDTLFTETVRNAFFAVEIHWIGTMSIKIVRRIRRIRNNKIVIIMKKIRILLVALSLLAVAAEAQNVSVVYSGTSATVTADSIAIQYLTITQSGAHVSIAQSDSLATEITYNLSGTSSDGEFYMSGSYKATIELNGLTLINATPVYSGAAIHIQNGKRIDVKVITGTTNSLTDAATGTQKSCLYAMPSSSNRARSTSWAT